MDSEDDVDRQCNSIIEEAMRRVSTVRGVLQVYALAYCDESEGEAMQLRYMSNAGRRGAIALLDDVRRGLAKKTRRLNS